MLIYILPPFLISFINFSRFNACFLRLVFFFFFDNSGSGFSSAASVLASRIAVIYKFRKETLLPLKSLLILANGFFVFQIYFQFSFLRFLLNSSCLGRASLVDISRFLILSRKATASFNSWKSITIINNKF